MSMSIEMVGENNMKKRTYNKKYKSKSSLNNRIRLFQINSRLLNQNDIRYNRPKFPNRKWAEAYIWSTELQGRNFKNKLIKILDKRDIL